MTKIKSEGKCVFCNKTVSKVAIHRHLQKHLEDKSLQNKPGASFLLKIEQNPRWGAGPYFLSLWIDGETTMDELDAFLRAIWLECCGHMSSFEMMGNKGNDHAVLEDAYKLFEEGRMEKYELAMEALDDEISFEKEIKNVFQKGLKVRYQYDFGSTTELQLTVVNEYPVKADQPILLLSRNEPLELWCETCGKSPATVLCSVCNGYGEDTLFCPKCAKKHAKLCEDFDDYGAIPIVNSPRMGVCGYDGGRIDKERDGVFTPGN